MCRVKDMAHLPSPAPGLLDCFLAPSRAFPVLSCCFWPEAAPFIVVADMLALIEELVGQRVCRRGRGVRRSGCGRRNRKGAAQRRC